MDCLENGLEDGIAVLLLPQRYRQRLRTSNLAERMNEEIRRRERVIRIFPNDDAAMRLIGALLAEKYEEWQTMAKYFEDFEWKAIYIYFKEKIPKECPVLSEVILRIARLGGHKKTKNGQPPGIKTMWIGFQQFTR